MRSSGRFKKKGKSKTQQIESLLLLMNIFVTDWRNSQIQSSIKRLMKDCMRLCLKSSMYHTIFSCGISKRHILRMNLWLKTWPITIQHKYLKEVPYDAVYDEIERLIREDGVFAMHIFRIKAAIGVEG